MFGYPCTETFQDPFGAAFAAHVDAYIIGVTAKTYFALFQFFIQLIQINISWPWVF